MSASKQEQLDALNLEIETKDICPSLRAGATQLVRGRGSLDARIVFIGEAPGEKEDMEGRPFIGAAGKFLSELLLDAGLDEDEAYITNIVKYRPEGNRDPLPEEIAAFSPYLGKEMEIIDPDIIAPLGRFAMNYFLPGEGISQVHGQPRRMMFGGRERILLPLYHPAYALYGGKRQVLKDDFKIVPDLLAS